MEHAFTNPDLRDWQSSGKKTQINGHSLFYRDQGDGPVLLMVHGFPTSSWDWQFVLQPLSDTFRVIAPDLLGYGFSDKPDNVSYSTSMHADIVLELMSKLGIKSAHILTYSFGCSVVQEIMARELEDTSTHLTIQSITFLNGGLFPDSNHPNRTQKLLLSPLGPFISRFMKKDSLARNLKTIFGPDTQPSEQLIQDYWELLIYKHGKDLIPKLIGYLRDRKSQAGRWRNAIKTHPASQQLIVGMSDAISGPEVADEYENTRPNPLILKLDNIGHYPQLEAPKVVIESLRRIVSPSSTS